MHTRHIIRPAIGTGLILLIPLIAMQFTTEVSWDLTDFVVMGALLFAVGLALEFTIKTCGSSARCILAIAAILIAFLLTWIELAVGIFGTPFAGS